MNKNSLCRLCLSNDNVDIPIFGQHDNSTKDGVLSKILQFAPIKISENDSLPKHICNSCLKLLELFHQFSVTTANSEIKLLQAISTSNRIDAETPRVFSYVEPICSPKIREDSESIYSTPKETATHKDQCNTETDSYEIFYAFRNCFSVDTINNIPYVTPKNSPNIQLLQLLPTESSTDLKLEIHCEDKEEPNETQNVEDGLPDVLASKQFKDCPIPNCVLYPPEVRHILPRPFRVIKENPQTTNAGDTESLDIQNFNSEIFHSGSEYIYDLDMDLQVTLLDEHLLPLFLVTKKHAPLRWLLEHYCKLSGNTLNQIGFRYKGDLIKHTVTACDLGLRNGDILNVVLLWQQAQVIVGQ